MSAHLETISRDDPRYPALFSERFRTDAPPELTAFGNFDLLTLPKTALFCSARCPSDVILRTYDQAAHWRNESGCIVSGFHSPVEKECLRILLRGTSPVIICPARGLPKLIPLAWRAPLAEGRLLIATPFPASAARISAAHAEIRNRWLATHAARVLVAWATPGGRLEASIRDLAANKRVALETAFSIEP